MTQLASHQDSNAIKRLTSVTTSKDSVELQELPCLGIDKFWFEVGENEAKPTKLDHGVLYQRLADIQLCERYLSLQSKHPLQKPLGTSEHQQFRSLDVHLQEGAVRRRSNVIQPLNLNCL